MSRTCLVSVQRNRHSAPCELVGQMGSLRLYPERIEVVTRRAQDSAPSRVEAAIQMKEAPTTDTRRYDRLTKEVDHA